MGGWNIFYALINFAILCVGLWFLGKKIVINMIVQTQEKARKGLESAEQARQEAEKIGETLKQMEQQCLERCQETLEQAQCEHDALLEFAAEEEKSLIQNREKLRRDERELVLQQALDELRSQSRERIISSARELLAGEDYAQARQAVAARFARELPELFRLTDSEKAKLHWGEKLQAQLSYAEPVPQELTEQIRGFVQSQGEIDFELKHEPELIGGLRLQLGSSVYDGSLASMLQRVSSELERGENIGEDITEYFGIKLSQASTRPECYQIGRVLSFANGICRISGLSDVMAGEVLRFESGLSGLVMDIDKDKVSAVVLGEFDKLHDDDLVRRTGRVMEVPVGEGLIGRVVDGLGQPVDGKGPLNCSKTRAVESPAPGIVSRRPVTVPLQTGIKAIDALVPIGRGQRELIIGDRKTGKTSIAVDTIINQKGKDVICIYVAIGQKESTVAGLVKKLREYGAMDYSIVVAANASEPAPMLYISPYTGTAIGEELMLQGKHVLIVYDDLSRHAVAYRELSLLLHRPPGREAFPGDVFFLHSRLLERSACLDEKSGGGSMTALPIVETQAGDISAYIPTNVISITDGQIFLEEGLFNSGVRPAINAGLSVSRVGGAAQPKAMKQFAGRLRMDLAQYRELESFSQFGSELDEATRNTLVRGRKLTELLKQKRFSPRTAAQQVIAIFAATQGHMDHLDEEKLADFEERLCDYVMAYGGDICQSIENGDKLSEEQIGQLSGLIWNFRSY